MSNYLNLYQGNPTAGGTDGTAVSTDNSFTAPINFELDAAINETKQTKCAIRTEQGYAATNVTIQVVNDTNARFKLCKTANGTYADSITFDSVSAANSIFYVKATSADTDRPQSNRKVKLRHTGGIRAVTS